LSTTTILIADDHDVVRRGLRTILESRPDWQVVAEATDGRSAVVAARQMKPQIAIIDYVLPHLNGIEAARQIRNHVPVTEVLMFTMHHSEDLLQHALQAGARGFVLKTDASDDLIAAVRALAEHKPFFSGTLSQHLIGPFLSQSNCSMASGLTLRERSVVHLVAEGKTNKQMASALGVSAKTIELHRAAALRKLKLKTTADLVRYAVQHNLLS
jgi:DNA-binding NarL/FixJ family response regulator